MGGDGDGRQSIRRHDPRRSLADLEQDLDEGERYIVFAEDGLRAIFEDILGFPDLDSAVFMAGNP